MNKQTIIIVAITLAIGLGGGYWLGHQPSPAKHPAPSSAAPHADGRKVLFWRNPMNPAITSPVFMKDEMGMDYIPVYDDADRAVQPAGTVKIDPTTMQNIGVRTATAEQRPLSHIIQALGRVAVDESRISHIHAKAEGWIEQMFVHNTGDSVRRNSMLLSLYAPKLVSGQQEYLLALNNYKALSTNPYADIGQGARELKDSARERLRLLDVPEHQLRELEQSGKIKKSLHIHSPFNGVVMQIGAREGQYVTAETELFTLADLSRVWVFVDVYENDLPWIKKGDRAEVRASSLPGRTLVGRVAQIYPYFEKDTRTVKVRLEFNNRDLSLKPEMFVNATLQVGQQKPQVVVPSEAVVRSGDGERVFVETSPGKYEPRKVTIGLMAEGYTQILSGIQPGDSVVTSAQFLIDSESKLREAVTRMRTPNAPKTPTPPAPSADMDMSGMSLPPQEASHDHSHH